MFEKVLEPRTIEDIGDEGNNSIPEAAINQFLLDLEELDFALLEEEQLAGSVSRDLAAEFAADAAAGTGYHDDTAAKCALDFLAAELDLFAAEEILELHGP